MSERIARKGWEADIRPSRFLRLVCARTCRAERLPHVSKAGIHLDRAAPNYHRHTKAMASLLDSAEYIESEFPRLVVAFFERLYTLS